MADLLVTAQGMVNEREAKAQMFWADYRLMSWQPALQVATVRSPQGDTYAVDLAHGACPCPDYQERVWPINARLEAAGYGGGVECKHCQIGRRLVARQQSQARSEVRRTIQAAAAKVAAGWGA